MIRLNCGSLVAIAAGLALGACNKGDSTLPSLKDQSGYFRPMPNAPESRFVPVGQGSAVGGMVVDSSFGPAATASSDFRLAEVAPDRLEETRTLLFQLGAKQDPDKAIRFSLPADILFDFDKATLRPDAQTALLKAQQLVAAYPKAPVAIIGYTDAKGDDVYNDRLSMARAKIVWGRLQSGDNRQASVTGNGERDPVAPNAHPDGSDDPEGRQRNRRVEIILSPIPGIERG